MSVVSFSEWRKRHGRTGILLWFISIVAPLLLLFFSPFFPPLWCLWHYLFYLFIFPSFIPIEQLSLSLSHTAFNKNWLISRHSDIYIRLSALPLPRLPQILLPPFWHFLSSPLLSYWIFTDTSTRTRLSSPSTKIYTHKERRMRTISKSAALQTGFFKKINLNYCENELKPTRERQRERNSKQGEKKIFTSPRRRHRQRNNGDAIISVSTLDIPPFYTICVARSNNILANKVKRIDSIGLIITQLCAGPEK